LRPPGAERIFQLRLDGSRPGELVVCSTIGSLPFEWLVELDFDTQWDLLWAVDLDVCLVASVSDGGRIGGLLRTFMKHRPKTITLWLDDAQKGYDVRFFPKIGSITGPPDKWEWEMDVLPMIEWQNASMTDLMKGVAV